MHSRAVALLLALAAFAGCRADPPPATTSTVSRSSGHDGAAAGAGSAAADLDDQTWRDAQAAGLGNATGACGGLDPVRNYQARYPTGRHLDEARKLLPELEKECEEMTRRSQVAAPWVERQRQRQVTYLARRDCIEACDSKPICERDCVPAPTFRNRCVPCVVNGRCQILTNSEAPGSLDCCLPIADESGCIKR